jgi:glucose/arabinose dehydrogenase
MKLLVLSCALAGLAACGGGGGGMSVSAPLPPTAPPVITPPVSPPATLQLALQPVASGLAQPLYLTAPAGDSRLFIVERPGRIRIVANGALLAAPFLDISSQTTNAGERGLLSMAFHPQYAQNGSFFIYYTDSNGDIAVDRMKVSAGNANLADPATAGRVITIPHREFSNHNGGQLAFGADGYLYIGTGDGGGAGDPLRNGQNLNSLLGKILRLNVGIVVPGQTYGIPADNPYAGQAGRRGEIWAAGLRNPWRFSFDRGDGLLYIADVGQDQREEVDVAPATQAGLNYGWNVMEGTACYNAASCSQAGLALPVFEYLHGANDANGCSITGGYVYRGAAIPELAGTYFYSDYCKGYLKSFAYRNGAVSAAQEWAVDNPGNVLSFGQDAQGELYVLAGSGQVFRIVRR